MQRRRLRITGPIVQTSLGAYCVLPGTPNLLCHNLSLRGPVPVGALFFSWRRADVRWMPRYYFIPVYPDRIIGDDRGTVVPSDEAAIGAAREIIDELLEDCGPDEPRPIIMVRNEAGEVVYQFPSN